MGKRWSKIQSRIYALIDPALKLQIHCAAYREGCDHGFVDSGRYWVTLDKKIIWDFPKQFITWNNLFSEDNLSHTRSFISGDTTKNYTYSNSDISDLLREYIDTPLDKVLYKVFDNDLFGLTDVLKAADRRIGKKKLFEYFQKQNSDIALSIFRKRWPTINGSHRKA